MRRFTLLIGLLAGPVTAQDISLAWPVDCENGFDCVIQQYVDHDPGPGYADFTCNHLSYDGHTGTDIRVADLEDMAAEVGVLAAAPGIVRGVRDGVEDAFLTPERRAALQGKGCGNGVVIDHADGWQTQYCHLLDGSVTVRSGDRVQAGTRLGAIGLSGFTDFPHLEFLVRKDGEILDPFNPDQSATCTSTPIETLWQETPTYIPGALLSAGFNSDVPSFDAVKEGTADRAELSDQSDKLILWGFVFGPRSGDTLRLSIIDPEGADILVETVQFERNQAQAYRAVGVRLTQPSWPQGSYLGLVEHIRDGALISTLTTDVALTSP